MGPPSVRTYDPRRGEDFRINTPGRTFSSLDSHFYVLDNAADLGWIRRVSLLKECFLQTSKFGFFTLVPWVPGAKKLKTAIKREFQSVFELDGTFCGYFDIESDSIQKLFEMREMFGGDKSGELGLGGCLEKFSPPVRVSLAKRESWDFFHVIRQPAKIGCFLYFGEMCQTTFMTRLFPELDSWLGQLPLP